VIIEERFVTYVNSLNCKNSDFLDEIEGIALAKKVPIIRKETQSLLRILLQIKQPKQILEVGTAIGFSALFMEEVNPTESDITTIENDKNRIAIAHQNFINAGKDDLIHLVEGDAQDILLKLNEKYDFIFMDAAKGQYLHFLPLVLQLLKPGAIIVSDNVLQDGDIIQSRFAVTRRNRTIHKRMREYLYSITHNEELTTTILTVGDGIAISVKK
jgi:predicted O-methyltransferase YrrM